MSRTSFRRLPVTRLPVTRLPAARLPCSRLSRLAPVALLLAALAAPPAVLAERVTVPGTRLSLEAPAGFTLAERFPGFGHAESGASIMITEMPAPVSQVRTGMTAEALATRGITVVSSEEVAGGGGQVLLIAATQRAGGRELSKWMAISGDESYTVILLATYPADQAAALAAPLRAALLSAQRSATAPDPFDGLPFTLEEKGALKISNRVANALLLTEGGVQRVLQSGEPLLVVAASLSEVDLGDLAAFAEARLRQTEQLTGPWTSSGRGVELEGLAGWELEGQATEKKSGQVLAFYQLVVADGPRNYLIVQAMVDTARAAELLPQFRAVGHSVRKKGD